MSMAAFATVRPIADQLDIGPMNTACDYCKALHWIDEWIGSMWAEQPCFESCCKQGDVVLPLFRPPPQYLQTLLQSQKHFACAFWDQLCLYNAALAFTSINCTATDCGATLAGINCFQIHGKLYHLTGPIKAPSGAAP